MFIYYLKKHVFDERENIINRRVKYSKKNII